MQGEDEGARHICFMYFTYLTQCLKTGFQLKRRVGVWIPYPTPFPKNIPPYSTSRVHRSIGKPLKAPSLRKLLEFKTILMSTLFHSLPGSFPLSFHRLQGSSWNLKALRYIATIRKQQCQCPTMAFVYYVMKQPTKPRTMWASDICKVPPHCSSDRHAC